MRIKEVINIILLYLGFRIALNIDTGKLLDRFIDLYIKSHLKNSKTPLILIASYLVI